MGRKKADNTIPQEIIDKIISSHESQVDDTMGNLHNRFVAYISEARVPLPMVITVLEILLDEALEMAKLRYLKE
jgi:hypothetical protein